MRKIIKMKGDKHYGISLYKTDTASGKNTPTAAATAAKAVNTSAAVAQKASAKAEKI